MKLAFYHAWTSSWKTGWKDRVISIFTVGRFSHVELVFSNGQCFSSSPRDGGTRFKEINFLSDRWTFVDIKIQNENSLRQWCQNQEGKPYDWIGIFGILLNISHPEKWFCTEVVASGLNFVEGTKFKVNSSPSSLYRQVTTFTQET
jgi:uncharacterized protein YycO